MCKAEHSELVQVMLRNLQPVLYRTIGAVKSEHKNTGKLRASTPIESNSLEDYDVDVFLVATKILSTISRLRQANVFIKNYPKEKKGSETTYTKYDGIQYHYGFFISTVVSISDLSLILVNNVFRLGNPEKHCRMDIISKNEWIRDTKVLKRLEELNKIIKPYRDDRNQLLHRGRMPDLPNSSEGSSLDCISFFNSISQYKSDFVPSELSDKLWKTEQPKISKCLQTTIIKLDDAITLFFDQILPYYTATRARIEN
jgi:Cthe_2314-like HEPN